MNRDSADSTFALTAPARPAFLGGIHDLLEEVFRRRPEVRAADRARFESALIEIVGNVVVHSPAAPGRAAVTMSVEVTCAGDRLLADVRDDGAPAEVDLDDVAMPDWEAESGRGLALARAMTDDLRYERVAGGNRWLITCIRSE